MIRSATLGLCCTVALVSCWFGTPTIQVVPVLHTRYVHDVPRSCAGLPEFPAIVHLTGGRYVGLLDDWIRVAANCLDVNAYPLRYLLEPVSW